jgi:hypothetical protein
VRAPKDSDGAWPLLDYAATRETCEALHLWTQVAGKVRLACTPWLNHSWQTPLYVTARGLGTGLIPHEDGPLDLEFDLTRHVLRARTPDAQAEVALQPMSTAAFYDETMRALDFVGAPVSIYARPNELPDATPFADDLAQRAYDPVQARRLFGALAQANRLLAAFRTGFLGKASPVHLFWGGFDLAVTRFSGRRAPQHPGGVPHLPDAVTREAYSHEVSSAGFWPGGPGCERACFYSYAYPEPAGFRDAEVSPAAAGYDQALGEFLLPYDAVRAAADPDAEVLAFLQSTYAAAASLGHWDRQSLECDLGEPGRPRSV